MKDYRSYETPLNSRYASEEMKYLFSSQYKFSTWRKLWIALAESEQELGLPITDEQLNEMRAHIDDIDFDKAAEYEKKFRHDVMAHVHTYGSAAPRPGESSTWEPPPAMWGDNTDVIIMRGGPEDPPVQTAGSAPFPLGLCREEYKNAHSGLYPLPAGPAHHVGKATCGPMTSHGHRGSGKADGRAEAAGQQGHHRYPGQLPGAFRRRLQQGASAGWADRQKNGL